MPHHHRDRLPVARMGLLFIQAVQFADIPVMAAYLCLIALIFVAHQSRRRSSLLRRRPGCAPSAPLRHIDPASEGRFA